MAHLERLLDRVASASLRRPRLMTLITIALILVSLGGLTQLKFDDGTRSIFASSHSVFEAYSDHVEDFAQSDTIAVLLVSADRPFDAESWSRLRTLVVRARDVEGVDGVFSVFGVNTLHPVAGDIGHFSSDDLALLPNLRAGRGSVRNYFGANRSLLSDDRRQTVVIVSFADAMQNLALAEPALSELASIADHSTDEGLRVELTGMLPIRQWIIAGIIRDQAVINIIGAIIGFVISLLLFRSFWIAVLNGVAPVIAVTLSLGSFGLLGFEINTVRNALPVLILVLAMADCIHMTFEFCRAASDTEDRSEAVMRMVREIGPPCILTSLTTMLAFASLYYSQSPLIQSLSISGILAVGIALLVVLFVHPLVFALTWNFRPTRAAFQQSRNGFLKSFWIRNPTAAIVRFRLPVASFSLALGAGLLIVFLPIETDFRFYEFVDEDQAIIDALERAEAIAGPTQAIDIPLRPTNPEAGLSDEALEDARSIHGDIAQAFPEPSIVSVENVAQLLEARGEMPSWNNVRLALASLPSVVADSVVSRNEDAFLMRLAISDQRSADIRALADRIQAHTATMESSSLTAGEATGLAVVAARISDDMIRQLSISFLIAALICPVLIGLWHRRWDFGLAALLPNILPIVAVGAWLSTIGSNIQFASALALSIAFGIAVDDTVHVLNRLAIQEKGEGSVYKGSTIIAAMDEVTPALIATTLILMAGLSATLFSMMPTARFFSLICMAIFMLALIADLLILPAILALFADRRCANQSTQ